MSPTEWVVVAAGLATIVWINWYFFIAERSAAVATEGAGGIQEVTIAVQGGYDPATVRVRSGRPVRLVFDRQETSSCSEEVVLDGFGIRKFLPPFARTTIEFTPRAAGTYDFTCGMGMLHGTLIVE